MQIEGHELEPLKPIDLPNCHTVADMLNGYYYSCGRARELGEVARTLAELCRSANKPYIIFGGRRDSCLGKVLSEMVERNWFQKILMPYEYRHHSYGGENVLIVDNFYGSDEDALYKKPKRSIFILPDYRDIPAHTGEGYYHDAVFEDPEFVIPALYHFLKESLAGKPTSIIDFMHDLRRFGGIAPLIPAAAENFAEMVSDPDMTIILTITGVMTIAQFDWMICDIIERKMCHVLSCTGALMAHGLTKSIGLSHFKHNPHLNDSVLRKHQVNRITSSYEMEESLDQVEKVEIDILDSTREKIISPSYLHEQMGKYLAQHYQKERGILKSAYLHNVPVFVPAFSDSEIQNNKIVHNRLRKIAGLKKIFVDEELDVERWISVNSNSKKLGIFAIGGGPPRNTAQNTCPLIDILNKRAGESLIPKKFSRGVRICADPPDLENMSTATFAECVSWGKAEPDGNFVEIRADAISTWPFIVKYAMEITERI
ncbi:hypothetical protein A3B18_00505 [Candidatus Giovannonibacteria bacterium RIFCSPLOWO2_01_FULL_46_13]|uniref:Deoxyhypusine synthase n=1 Tax=Candidatus Giovannonibacteria bacterium RIFCSPLOWO2_01_FULL_46_13 TaxID=1798352 RepID=A0A1F5X5N0_9BACT|nr:MAG: hypothetical protein A3B18_00505 [Candidatus Giovannonibacteria bacterium RIFCSPLOWO2_01_FULL_46_13]